VLVAPKMGIFISADRVHFSAGGLKWSFHFSPAAEMEFSFQQTAEMKNFKFDHTARPPIIHLSISARPPAIANFV
jgi:hypothetical protein